MPFRSPQRVLVRQLMTLERPFDFFRLGDGMSSMGMVGHATTLGIACRRCHL